MTGTRLCCGRFLPPLGALVTADRFWTIMKALIGFRGGEVESGVRG